MPTDKPINILVVDDLPEKLLAYRAVLEELGQNLVIASSGEEALKLVLQDEYAVILLDVNMPGMDGFETATMIRKRKKSSKTPIIFLTAFADEMRTAQGYALGAVDYIPTPVVPEILRAKVNVFIELFRLRENTVRQAEEHAKREAAEKSARHADFLSRISASLADCIEMENFLATLVRLPVPYLAGLCAVTLADQRRRSVRTEVAWTDEIGILETQSITGTARIDSTIGETIERVLATGKRQAVRCDRLVIRALEGTPPIEREHVISQSPLGLTVVLPLGTRGKVHAVLTLALGYSGRTYNPDAIALADDVAGRAAVALENALLVRNIQEADRRKDEFLAMLAHELRNPLGPIRNAVHLAKMIGPHQPEMDSAIEMIDRQVTHITRLVDDLLNMTRIASGKISLKKEPTDLCRIVRQTTNDYRSLLESGGLSLDVSIPNSPVWVNCDPIRMAQVVGNLVHNAHKFTDPGGRVRVSVAPDSESDSVAITIHDTGIGIEPALLPRVFGVFVQAEQGLDRSRGGLGLGLALVSGLVSLHGGCVTAHSEGIGKGAEFTVRLKAGVDRSPAVSVDRELVPNGTPRRILVIEDNRDTAESTRILLAREGHDVRIAATGIDGIESARTFRPEVILCDIGLPGGMSGYDVIRAVRQEAGLASTYVIALTGYGRSEDQERAIEAGFNLHITKPVDFPYLRQALAELP